MGETAWREGLFPLIFMATFTPSLLRMKLTATPATTCCLDVPCCAVGRGYASYAPSGASGDKVMIGALRQRSPILSVASFRAWLASRPDEEHWELIEGVPMMTTPPNRRHQREQPGVGSDEFTLPEFGLACLVRDIYRDTSLG